METEIERMDPRFGMMTIHMHEVMLQSRIPSGKEGLLDERAARRMWNHTGLGYGRT